MNTLEKQRQQVIDQLQTDIEKYGGDEFGADSVAVDIVTARQTLELLKMLEAPVDAKWHYYINDEGKARWKCTNCGKIVRHWVHEKKRCSVCGARMTEEC